MPTLSLVAQDATHGSSTLARRSLDRLAPLFVDLVPLIDIKDAGAATLLQDLAFALADLLSGHRSRMVVPTEATSPSPSGRRGPVWELGLERDGTEVLVSLFRQGAQAHVAQSEHRVDGERARRAVLDAIELFSTREGGLAMARETLLCAADDQPVSSRRAPRCEVSLRSSSKSPLRISAVASMRSTDGDPDAEVSRADLHALLCRGEVTLRLEDSTRKLRDVHLLLVAERWLELSATILEARRTGRGILRRVEGGGAVTGVQVDTAGMATLLLGPADNEASARRLPPIDGLAVATALVSFGRRLAKRVAQVDPTQRANLRLSRFATDAKRLAERLEQAEAAPEPAEEPALERSAAQYRAYAETADPPAVSPRTAAGKLRFEESWRADVPGLDLRAFFLAGDRVIAGSSRELACIERRSGELLWTRRTHKAVSVMTPAGVVRLGADGQLTLHDLDDGEPAFELQLSPCVGASASGAVVSAPGLPTMLLITEGARHLAAIDLDSSEIRWRRAVRRRPGAGKLKLRRVGKLVVVSTPDAHLFALDLLTGEVVWRHRGRDRHDSLVVDRGELYAVVTGPAPSLERLDPFSGGRVWRADLPRRATVGSAPLCTTSAVALVTRDDDRSGLVVFERESGAMRFDLPGGLTAGRAMCLALDDAVLAHSDSGELVSFGDDGGLRYRHVFAGSTHVEPSERPRSHAPVLRSGALFLPQDEVQVVRPSDGTVLGRLPCDLVADAMRVDEQCGAYVAEASGYVAAYHALPMLTLVRPVD